MNIETKTWSGILIDAVKELKDEMNKLYGDIRNKE